MRVCADDNSTPRRCWPSDVKGEEMVSLVGLVFLAAAQLKDSAFDRPSVLSLPLRQRINCFFE